VDQSQDDRFVVFVRLDPAHGGDPEASEEPLAECSSYAEACRIRNASQRECVIRYIGCVGGGD
jgi:hypothetical protein